MPETIVVWVRRDLRVRDNPTLTRAVRDAGRVVPLYVLPSRLTGSGMYDRPKVGPYRARFLLESVADLATSLQDRGGDLLVRHGDPGAVVPAVAERFDADAVYFQTLPGTEEAATETAVRTGLSARGVGTRSFWTHTLYHPEDLPTPPERIDDTFTPWRQSVESSTAVRDPLPAPEAIQTPELSAGDDVSMATFDYDPADAAVDERGVLDFEGGETAGLERVRQYVWVGDHLRRYKQTRNGLLGSDYSSKFSPWLAQGCLSPRHLHAVVEQYEAERVANDSTYWLVFELAWRDFFQFQFRKHGAAFFRPGGIRNRSIEWSHDRERFERWAAGETGIPFVDANMRELNATGYLSNRGRQNVASFLANDLGIDWRRGAAYFETVLVDYDVAANWGNWAYNASVGNDSRDSSFDVLDQARRYDGDAAYVSHWIPELDGLAPAQAHRPWTLTPAEQREYGLELGVDYPRPMIDLTGSG
jgi:deoxyribodipyrimidine photo-lyase